MENIKQIQQQFTTLPGWEERYRLLIQLGKKLPPLDTDELSRMPLIHGCEVEVRFTAQKQPDGGYRFSAYSEARIMNGLLYLLLSALQSLPLSEIRQFDMTALLQSCGIAPRLSETRLNGLKNIESLLHQLD
ncbi:SufE family protein [Pasteurella testudinis]|uniref:SufE family protein n=1 Tax=Pasteurella testudinis TaxID=761 RepID=UPI004059EF29